MSTIDRFRSRVRRVLERLSGDYSAGAEEIRPDDAAPTSANSGADVKVTRARLKRPGAAADRGPEEA